MESGKLIGFVGLDELGLQIAASLLRHGYAVQAFEVSSLSLYAQRRKVYLTSWHITSLLLSCTVIMSYTYNIKLKV